MKQLFLGLCLIVSCSLQSQTIFDTLAIQDFETVPSAPVWTFTGTLNDLQFGTASATSCIPNTPLGIGNSQSWHVVSVSGGNQITFDNINIPVGYDSIRVNFSLAALNLIGSTGGPDDLDYVLVEYSLDNGASWIQRLRIKGAIANNSFWPFSASGEAKVQYLPATEAIFQPLTSGLQDAEGYSFCEISFPGSINQVSVRITPRSSSSSDSWLIDNLVITGENECAPITNSISATVCDSYTSPSGNYTWTNSNTYLDTIPTANGCDSIITIDLTVNHSSATSISEIACNSFTSPSGNYTWTSSNTYIDTIPNAIGCDSIITIDLTIQTIDQSITQSGNQLTSNENGASYSWINCTSMDALPGETGQSFIATSNGDYAVVITTGNCSDTSDCITLNSVGIENIENESLINVFPNPSKGIFHLIAEENALIQVCSISGELIFSQYSTSSKNKIDLSNYSDGIYILKVAGNGYIRNIKLIKE